ncbi:putative phytanoyldioxygenase [Phaeomoniella chlamydospora]|uniref:Putative phytanoyldioxygenase n=1 Tax=Phaeomoniella chlamydospora TaxID=158046 RepID=A0A0G2GUR3_PHACM|nr:putative phytanoyldioxygenase [Phaeomoniella chlamydospora]
MAPAATTSGTTLPIINGKKKPTAQETALSLIEEALPKMGSLKAILQIDLGLEEGPIFLDAREEPKLVKSLKSGEPNCKVKIKPEYIKEFVEGKLEPRYGLFKDGFFDETTLPTGEIRVAVKFADFLCPSNPTHPRTITAKDAKLPEPTEDMEQVREDMKKWGYGLVKNALSPEQVEVLKEAIRQQGEGEMKAGVGKCDGGPNAPNQRIWTLINKGREFHDLLEHPLIDEIVPEFLGDHALIHSYSANIARPGNVPMMLHTDQVAIQPPMRNIAFGLNIMWFLTDVTEKNGGTRVFPGSHLGPIAPDDPFNIDGTIAAEGPAGTALVFESRLWHATGPNRETSGERPVILMFFMRSFIRQQENNFLSIRPEVEATMSDRVRKMLGYCTTGALGGVEGEVREGNFVKRLENAVGPFRDTHKATPFRQDLKA